MIKLVWFSTNTHCKQFASNDLNRDFKQIMRIEDIIGSITEDNKQFMVTCNDS